MPKDQSPQATGLATLLQLHREEVRTSPSARWYSDATGYDPLALPETINSYSSRNQTRLAARVAKCWDYWLLSLSSYEDNDTRSKSYLLQVMWRAECQPFTLFTEQRAHPNFWDMNHPPQPSGWSEDCASWLHRGGWCARWQSGHHGKAFSDIESFKTAINKWHRPGHLCVRTKRNEPSQSSLDWSETLHRLAKMENLRTKSSRKVFWENKLVNIQTLLYTG